MPIEVKSVPTPGIVGLAGYAAGHGKGMERKKKQRMALLERQQRLGYRDHLRGLRQQRLGGRGGQQQIEGSTIEDPLTAEGADRKLILAQRKTNARNRRMGRPVEFPDAEPKTISGEENKRRREVEERDEGRRYKEGQEKKEREYGERLAGEEREREDWKDLDKQTAAEFDEIAAEGGNAFRDPAMQKEFDDLKRKLWILDNDENQTPAERHKKAATERQKFLSKFNRKRDLLRPEERKGYERVTDDGRLIRKGMDGQDEDLGPAPISMLNPDQVKAREAGRQSQFGTDAETGRRGQWRRDKYGEYFDPFEKGEGQTATEYNKAKLEEEETVDKTLDAWIKKHGDEDLITNEIYRRSRYGAPRCSPGTGPQPRAAWASPCGRRAGAGLEHHLGHAGLRSPGSARTALIMHAVRDTP